jgi:hypothetical protein
LHGGTFAFEPETKNCRRLNAFNFAHLLKSRSTYFRTELCDVVSCSWGKGSKYLLSTQICYLGASIFTRCMREPRYERKKNEPEPEPKEEPEPMEEPEPKKEVEVEKGLGSDDEDEEEQK